MDKKTEAEALFSFQFLRNFVGSLIASNIIDAAAATRVVDEAEKAALTSTGGAECAAELRQVAEAMRRAVANGAEVLAAKSSG